MTLTGTGESGALGLGALTYFTKNPKEGGEEKACFAASLPPALRPNPREHG